MKYAFLLLVLAAANAASAQSTVAAVNRTEVALTPLDGAAGETRTTVKPVLADSADSRQRFFNGPDADHLLGDWNGWRSSLNRLGIQFTGYWTGIASGNPIGGAKPGHVTTVDDTFIVANINLQRIAHWKHADMQMSFIDRGGRGLTNEYIGGQYNVQQCVGGQAPFFYQMFVEQSLADGKVQWKAGRLSASDDMNASPLYSLSLNNGIDGDIRNVLFDTQSSAYPFPTWGGYLHLNLSKTVAYKTALYQTTKGVFDSSTHGLDWAVHDGDGVITMHELVWSPTLRAGKGDDAKELQGHYWLGSTYTPWKGFTPFLSTQKVGNSYGFYVHADQMIHRPYAGSKASVTLWTAAAYYPQQNIAIVPIQINVGLVDQGRFGHREDDKTIVNFIYGQFSRDYAQKIVAAGKGNPNHEMVVELAHRIQLARHTFFQPDLQFDIRPAGTGRIPTAVVPGAELGIVF